MRTITAILMIGLFVISGQAYAQKNGSSKAERKLEKERRNKLQAEADMRAHQVALNALETQQWAFESDRLTDDQGQPINTNNSRPNVVGFDGEYFFGDVIIKSNNPRNMYDYYVYLIDSRGKQISKRVDKKGNLIYKFMSYPPTRSEATVVLYKDSGRATVTLERATYMGVIIPITKSWYFMTYERKGKERKSADK